MTIIQGPTMANPEAFSTVDELRRELHRANETMFSQALILAQQHDGLNQMASFLNDVLVAHLRGDHTEIGILMNTYLADRDALREALQARASAKNPRSMH